MALGLWAVEPYDVLDLRGKVQALLGSRGEPEQIWGDQGAKGKSGLDI